ncbi:MAG TPA: BamA/TamA family outer membrane protein [Vicinamibacteria bacterium]|nr:BamA/TamA family outer membrane protein [Vicinamibacteria bacterium]
MLPALLLSVALLPPAARLPAEPAATAAAPVVDAVRIEAEHPERLRGFVEVVPGRPLDSEAVRRSVELIFASGRFEDVRVELQKDEAGRLTLVFRPLPAPLLAQVRVEGDRVLSASQVARAARLRPGEPLWPARLDRASRDVALALARRGYQEARVEHELRRTPLGVDALFHLQAGPLVVVSRVSVDPSEPLPGIELLSLARPRRGEVYARERAEAAREAMARRLVRAGRWRAKVELRETYDPGPARMAIAFAVDPGPRMRLEARGAAVPQKLLEQVGELVRDGGAGADALEAGAERLEAHLRREGCREASVRARAEATPGHETIVYELQAGARASAASVRLRGADPSLLAGLRTQVGRPIQDSALDEDTRTLVARLEELGHFEARVESDLPEGGGELPVVFVAHPGPRAVVTRVDVVGPPAPAGGAEEGASQELPLRAGQPYRLADVARSRDRLLAAWRQGGYLEARVSPDVQLSEPRDQAMVRLLVDPGPRSIVDHVVLAGLGRTQPATVEREMVLRRGEPFSFERVLESQRRLSGLGIFEQVSIAEREAPAERRDVVVNLQEAPPTSVSWGVGYSEQDRFRGSVEVTRRNLGGDGRSASVFARGSFRGSRLVLTLREPWLLGRKLDSFVTGFWEEQALNGFDYNRKGLTLQVGKTASPHTSFILRYLLQDTRVFNVALPLEEIDRQYRTYSVSGPSGSVVFDTRDDPLEPRRGVFLNADLQLSLSALGGESYLKGYFQAANVYSLRQDLVLVVSGHLGLASTFGQEPTLLPQPERFFAGGDFGPRGFPFDMVGPLLTGTNGLLYPVGGNALVLGGAEVRYNMTRAFQLASFLDLGNVYLEPRDIDIAALRRSAGLGVRYRTPIGPIRLDWGYVLDRRPGEAQSRFHFTIGHAF